MRDDEIAREVRAHFSAEVEKARGVVGASRHGATGAPPHRRLAGGGALRTAARWLGAAALIATAPLCMLAGSRTHEPLAGAIQAKWDSGGRVAVQQLLRDAGGVLDAHLRNGEEQ